MRNGGVTSRYQVYLFYNVCPRGQDAASISHHCANTSVSGKGFWDNEQQKQMKYIGVTNPLPLIAGLTPMYLYYRLVTELNLLNGEIKGGLLFALLTIVLIVGPLALLMFCKIITVDNDEITLIYPFRLRTIKFKNEELKSVYRQLNNSGHRISFKETHLYFGQERRVKFNSFDILNFRGLSDRLEIVQKSPSR